MPITSRGPGNKYEPLHRPSIQSVEGLPGSVTTSDVHLSSARSMQYAVDEIAIVEVEEEGGDEGTSDGTIRTPSQYREKIMQFRERVKKEVTKREEKFTLVIKHLQKTRDAAVKECEGLRAVIEELEQSMVANKQANKKNEWDALALGNLKGGVDRSIMDMEINKKVKAVLMQGIRDLQQDQTVALGGLDDEDGENDANDVASGAFGRLRARLLAMLQTLDITTADCNYIESRYGPGMAGYMRLRGYLIFNGLVFVLIWTPVLVWHLNTYTGPFSAQEGLLPSFLYFSAWSLGGFPYTLLLLLTWSQLVLSSLRSWVQQHKEAQKKAIERSSKSRKFSAAAFNFWDFSRHKPSSIEDLRYSQFRRFETLLDEQDLARKLGARTTLQQVVLYFRRCLGVLLNTALVGSGAYGIYFVTTSIERVHEFVLGLGLPATANPFLAPVAITIINAALPKLTELITVLEAWDTSDMLISQQMFRLFVARQINLLFSLVTYWGMSQGDLLAFTALEFSWDSTEYTCAENNAGGGIFLQVVTEWALAIVSAVGMALVKLVVRRVRSDIGFGKKPPFSIANSIVELINFQSLVWASLPLFPFGSILTLLFSVVDFKFAKYRIILMHAPPKLQMNNAGDTFLMLYNISLFLSTLTIFAFFNCPWDCMPAAYLDQLEAQKANPALAITAPASTGVFRDTPDGVPWTEIAKFFTDNHLGVLYTLLAHPGPYMVVVTMLFVRQAFASNVRDEETKASTKAVVEKDREMRQLRAALLQKSKLLEAQSRAVGMD